jgi:hypothetical protein
MQLAEPVCLLSSVPLAAPRCTERRATVLMASSPFTPKLRIALMLRRKLPLCKLIDDGPASVLECSAKSTLRARRTQRGIASVERSIAASACSLSAAAARQTEEISTSSALGSGRTRLAAGAASAAMR